MKDGFFTFPETRFARTNTIWKQYWHLVSEVIEVGRALFWKDFKHAARELEDVGQSKETLQRILKRTGVDVEAARSQVIKGCDERGYYDGEAD